MSNDLRTEYEANEALHAVLNTQRRSNLSPRTQQVIAEQFCGDLEEAEHEARIVMARSTRYPEWMREVLGAQREGWRDPVSWAVRR
jgi:hypothetical protein